MLTIKYSSVPNKCVGWNKRVGRKKLRNLINVLDGINVMAGKTVKMYSGYQN